MYEAKICNLGLSLLIRLNQSFKYLSFLGGETQRPYRNNHGGALPAHDFFYPFRINPYCNSLGNSWVCGSTEEESCCLNDTKYVIQDLNDLFPGQPD